MQAVLTRKRCGCSASAISVEGSTFAVRRRSSRGALRTASFFLFKTGQTGRFPTAQERDETVMETCLDEHFGSGIDVVIDYLWGKSEESLFIARAKVGGKAGPTRFVQVGAASGTEIALPAAVLRSSPIKLMGSGLCSVSFDGLIECIGELLRATVPWEFKITISLSSS